MSYNRWGDIYKHLKSQGVDVYSPAQHEGECISPYVVVKMLSNNQVGRFSSSQAQYDVLIYIPKNQYSQLEDYVQKIKDLMKGLYPMIVPLGSQTPSYYDDIVKGHMVSVQYRNNQKL